MRKLYELKSLDSGQTLTACGREFTIWSAGPGPSTVWAYDLDGTWAVLDTRGGKVHVRIEWPQSSPNERLLVALALLRGHPYRVTWPTTCYPGMDYTIHLDPECRDDEAHRDGHREDMDPVRVRDIADRLRTGDMYHPGPKLCDCVWRSTRTVRHEGSGS